MAFTGRATYDNATIENLIALDAAVAEIASQETPVLDAIGMADEPVMSVKTEWFDVQPSPEYDTLNNSGAMAIGAGTCVVTNGAYFETGMVIMIEDEYLEVTNVSSNTLTVTRAARGTSAAEHADGSRVTILSRPALEGKPWDGESFRNDTVLNNYVQNFTRDVRLSGDELVIAKRNSRFAMQGRIAEKMADVLRDIEAAVLFGRPHNSTPGGSSTVARTMGGIAYFCSTNQNASNADLSETTHLDAAFRSIYAGHGRPSLMIGAPIQCQKVAKLLDAHRTTRSMEDLRLERRIAIYNEALGGECMVVPTRKLPNDRLWILDASKIRIRNLEGRGIQYVEKTSTGDYEGGQIIASYTVEIGYPTAAHYRWYGLKTT